MIAKKAQGISLTTIVIAVIALIVLIVVIIIFANKMSDSSKASGEVSEQYKGEICELPGTTRTCKIACDGVDYGQLDCAPMLCCAS